jgi:Ricin-type beta-trefoil lectin domain
VSLHPCGVSLSQLFEATCLDRWRNSTTGAALVIEPTSASAGMLYGLSGYSGYCNDPLSLISAIPWVTAGGVLTPLADRQPNQLRGSGLCISVQGPTDTDIGAAPCVNTWRQRLIAQQAGNLWRFQVNGTNTCLEPASQPSGEIYPVKLAMCGASTTQYFERQCTDRWRNPVTGMSLVVDTSTMGVFGKVFSSPCNDSRTAITPIAWVP